MQTQGGEAFGCAGNWSTPSNSMSSSRLEGACPSLETSREARLLVPERPADAKCRYRGGRRADRLELHARFLASERFPRLFTAQDRVYGFVKCVFKLMDGWDRDAYGPERETGAVNIDVMSSFGALRC